MQSVQQQSSDKLQLALEPLDTKKPMDISEEEELERISALLQRDNLVRGLGIVEHVYRSVLERRLWTASEFNVNVIENSLDVRGVIK